MSGTNLLLYDDFSEDVNKTSQEKFRYVNKDVKEEEYKLIEGYDNKDDYNDEGGINFFHKLFITQICSAGK